MLNCIIKTFLEAVGEDDKNMRIMDLGAGTGLAAIELKKHGFTNVDGLDLSPEMLEKAKEKNAYKNYICEAITEKRLDIPTGNYGALISVGAITSGYIKANAFDEILRLVKPGRYTSYPGVSIRRTKKEMMGSSKGPAKKCANPYLIASCALPLPIARGYEADRIYAEYRYG